LEIQIGSRKRIVSRDTMGLFIALLVLLVSGSGAFVAKPGCSFHSSSRRTTTTNVHMTEPAPFATPEAVPDAVEPPPKEKDDAPVGIIDKPPFPEGSDDELMYTFGVNLARQIGDIRPLVQTEDELAQVAKGVLDSFIGRFSEEGQIQLLKRRQEDLKKMISIRA